MWIVAIVLFLVYGAAVVAFFWFAAQPIILVGSAIMVVLVYARYFQAVGENLFWGEGSSDRLRGKEPAFFNYFFDKAWRDYALIIGSAKDFVVGDAKRIFGWGKAMMNVYAWPLGLVIWVVAAVAFIPACVVFAFAGLLHVSIVAALALLIYFTAGIVLLIEKISLAVRHIGGRCSVCFHSFSLPEYVCECGATHRNLVPGQYGAIFRRCSCGRELPTLFLFGRGKLRALCPHCHALLSTSVLTMRPVYVPVVGGVSSGKSSLMTATLAELQSKESGIVVTFPKAVSEQKNVNQRSCMRSLLQYRKGERMDKTLDGQVRGIELCLEDARKQKRLLYAYDAAGEIHRGEHVLGSLPYYSYIHGLIFLIDPFSLQDPRMQGLSNLQTVSGISPSSDSPKDVFDQVVRSLIRFSKRKLIAEVPVAVVLTKTDALGLHDRIQQETVPPVPGEKPPVSAELNSRAVRQWLWKNDGESVINSIERAFKNVRYFECSALGRIPGHGGQSFEAKGVLDPWAWILKDSGLQVHVSGGGPSE